MRTLASILAVLVCAPALAWGQTPTSDPFPRALRDLADLGAEARSAFPDLAALVDDAERLAARGGAEPDARAIRSARYGAFGAGPRAAAADRRALSDALAALALLERAAPARDASPLPYRALHDQLVGLIDRGFAARAREEGSARAPRLGNPHQATRSPAELFADLPSTSVTLYGVVGPAVVLVAELVGELRRGAPLAGDGPLGRDFARTLAQAGRGERYAVEGRSEAAGRYTGQALLETAGGSLLLTLQDDASPGRRLAGEPLEREPGAWRLRAALPETLGAAGAVAAAGAHDEALAAGELVLEARYRPLGAGVLEGRWRLLRAGEPVDEGRELLRRVEGAAFADDFLRMSPLMAEIVAACREVVANGTVPAELLLTGGNAGAPQAFLSGPELFGELARLIASARREVLLQFFVWEPDSEAHRLVLGALAELERRAAARGAPEPVRVRIVVNQVPLSRGQRRDLRALSDDLRDLGLDPRWVDLGFERYRHRLIGALHTKAAVVDGRRGFVTGANVEAIHDSGAPWFDAGFTVEGPVAMALRADFTQLWHQVTGAWLPALDAAEAADEAEASAGQDEPSPGGAPILVATRRADGNPLARSRRDPQAAAFLTAITRARELVRIQSPNLNDAAVKRALLVALLENRVPVELVLSKGFNERAERLPFQGGGNAQNVAELLAALESSGDPEAPGRLDVRWYADAGGELLEGNGPGASHAKYASFDRQVLIVGSGNLDTQAINHSREVNLVIDDAALAASWDAQLFVPNHARGVPARQPPALPLPGPVGVE